MKTLLWIDDYRNPFENDWLVFSPIGKECNVIWVKSYEEAINYLTENWVDGVCFDHDLGDNEKSGYDIAKYIVNKCIEDDLPLPKYNSQSSNPVGKQNILSLLDNFKKISKIMKNIQSFYVIIDDFNLQKFIKYDVMPYFIRCYEESKEKPKTFDEFKEFVDRKGHYMYWARCEYEIILKPWVGRTKEEKIDVWYQIENNLDLVVKLLMENVL